MDNALSERDWIARAQQADQAAWAHLFRQYYHRITGLTSKMLEDRQLPCLQELASEAVSETFAKAFVAIRSFEWRDEQSLYKWLAAIARNTVRDLVDYHHRDKRDARRTLTESRLGNIGDGDSAVLPKLQKDSGTPSRECRKREQVTEALEGLRALRPGQREVLTLRFLEGLSVEETARRIGRSPAAVMMLCNRGLRKLEEIMGSTSRS